MRRARVDAAVGTSTSSPGTSADVCELAVVGAGPAGATAALVAARAGLDVVLIEKARLPRAKTCGGGVVRRALEHLPAGVTLAVEREACAIELAHAEAGLALRVERERPLVLLGMRAELDAALAREAQAAGARLVEGFELDALESTPDGVVLRAGERSLRARLVLAADGVLSPSARLAGFAREVPAVPALEVELPADEASLARFDAPLFELGTPRDGYAWIFPKRAGLSCGVLAMRRGRVRLPAELERFLARHGLDARAGTRSGWQIPIAPRPGPLARGRVLLAGDAAGLADPVTGEGISLAIRSGRLAAEAAVEAWRGSELEPERARRAYERALAPLLRELAAARLLARVLYGHPALARALLRRHGRALAEAMARVVAGETSYRALLASPRSWLRLVRGGRGERVLVATRSAGT